MIPTVKVKDGQGGFWIIRESDYHPDRYTLYQESSPAAGESIQDRADRLCAEKTKAELYAIASDLEIAGRSKMNEAELALAVATAQVEAEP